jgi:flagellar biosynthesis protein
VKHIPIKKAVALKYNKHKNSAPEVASKGSGEIAKTIIKIAKESNIPIKEDPDLVEVLSKLDIGEEIPPKLYEVVAEIFSYIYRQTRRK